MKASNQMPVICPSQLEGSPVYDNSSTDSVVTDWESLKAIWLEGDNTKELEVLLLEVDLEDKLPFSAKEELHFVMDGYDSDLVIDSDGYVRKLNEDAEYSNDFAKIVFSDVDTIKSINLLMKVEVK